MSQGKNERDVREQLDIAIGQVVEQLEDQVYILEALRRNLREQGFDLGKIELGHVYQRL